LISKLSRFVGDRLKLNPE